MKDYKIKVFTSNTIKKIVHSEHYGPDSHTFTLLLGSVTYVIYVTPPQVYRFTA